MCKGWLSLLLPSLPSSLPILTPSYPNFFLPSPHSIPILPALTPSCPYPLCPQLSWHQPQFTLAVTVVCYLFPLGTPPFFLNLLDVAVALKPPSPLFNVLCTDFKHSFPLLYWVKWSKDNQKFAQLFSLSLSLSLFMGWQITFSSPL